MAQRITIGISASTPLPLRVSDDELTKLQGALGGEGWHTVVGEDGDVRVKLESVVWVRVEREESRVGFGLSGA
jgi:hypothetical protein